MVTQYPYELLVYEEDEATYNEQYGKWSNESGNWESYGACRDEKSSSGSHVITVDGEVYDYSWIIFLPKGAEEVLKGSRVKVMDGNETRLKGRVIRFSSDQLHCRIWL